MPVFNGYSPTVLPKPPDWPESVHVTGYWFLDQLIDWEPPTELVDFLDSGPAPVYVGFGSMHARSSKEMTRVVVEALSRVGLRGILLSGWGALSHDGLPDYVLPVKSVPHEWLFPRVTAVVHHGGAGTTGAGLRAGVPSILVPFFGDQYFWASRVAALGVGPESIPVKRLSVESLERALRFAVTDERMRERASDVGAAIQAENGVARVVEVLERIR
jgi:UDP:flavonoid glycosyltransferase YjiC (YdhE family)